MEDQIQSNAGVGATPMPPIQKSVPTNVTAAFQTLNSIGSYVNNLQNVSVKLPETVVELTPAVPPGGTLSPIIADALANVTNTYNALSNNAIGTPTDIAVAQSYAIQDLTNFVNSAVNDLNTNAVTIAALQSQVATLQNQLSSIQGNGTHGGGPIVPAPPIVTGAPPVPVTNPNQMTTTTFLVGVASVIAIGGGVWWVAKNAKTKAREAHAAGFKPKTAVANPKQLTTGGGR